MHEIYQALWEFGKGNKISIRTLQKKGRTWLAFYWRVYIPTKLRMCHCFCTVSTQLEPGILMKQVLADIFIEGMGQFYAHGL